MAKRSRAKIDDDITSFLGTIVDDETRDDCLTLIDMMSRITRSPPKMWAPGMIGFGSYHYRYTSGREGDWFLTGFSPRKSNLSLYLLPSCSALGKLTAKLGKFKTAKSCLYVKRLSDVDLAVLEKLIAQAVAETRKKYPDKKTKP